MAEELTEMNNSTEIVQLSEMTNKNQVLNSLKLSYFPLAGFVFNQEGEEVGKGKILLDEYFTWYYKVKKYLIKNSKEELQ